MPSGGRRENSGRKPGSPNKTTLLRREGTGAVAAIIAGAEPAAAAAVGNAHKLRRGKEILHEFANLYAGLAARYQPWPAALGKNPDEDEDRFVLYSKLAVMTADKSADFQDARYRAVAVVMSAPGDDRRRESLPAAEPADPAQRERWANQSYLKLVKGG